MSERAFWSRRRDATIWPWDAIDRDDLGAIIPALMRSEEKLDELLGDEEDDDDGEGEDLA